MENALRTTTRYIRSRECLLIDCDMSNYLIDYYLNAKQRNETVDPEHDEQLKQVLTCLALHLSIRPAGESVAWTIHMQAKQPYSLFATGSASEQFIIGRVLYEHITHTDLNIFHSQVSREKGSSSRSTVKFETNDIPSMFTYFYNQSEQLFIKVALLDDTDKAVALVAMPEFDREWFEEVTPQSLWKTEAEQNHKVIKECHFRYACNCSLQKLLPFFRSIDSSSLEELYESEDFLVIGCPRCGKQYRITKSELLQKS